MIPLFTQLDLTSADEVTRVLLAAAEANRTAACRTGSIDVIHGPGRLVATGDLHDNPLHLARLVSAAGLGGTTERPPSHLTLHEIIHSDRLVNGMDFSYRALTRVAALKSAHPEHVHTLLANHELSQVLGSGIVKDGVRVVEAFSEAVDQAFGEQAGVVHQAIRAFIRSMPLALRCETGDGAILCAHSLPGPEVMDRFDAGVLSRDLVDADFVPRRGSAHLMIWGRGHKAEQLRSLGEQWNVGLFVLGHEKADSGWAAIEPNAVVLNSDHEQGVYLELDLAGIPALASVAGSIHPLSSTTI
ncbi:MAG: hypothetical protein KF745_06770 [Phycisphaeraceae bacterium]|nr:hypothetical protein [Phycisphaeraceae bacterium]